MKTRSIVTIALAALMATSCVTIRKYEDATKDIDKLVNAYRDGMIDRNQLQGQLNDLLAQDSSLRAQLADLDAREQAFRERERQFNDQYADLLEKNKQLEAAELASKQQLSALRESLIDALSGFKNKGINVEERDGKVFVSMESKLLFASGRWEISAQGKEALRELAKVLESQKDLNIMVEGHTDTDVYRGRQNGIQDNWDLSVIRATAIVKQLLAYGPNIDPKRIEASGHGEWDPKESNETEAGKAKNRRTEIILTPKILDLYKLLQTPDKE